MRFIASLLLASLLCGQAFADAELDKIQFESSKEFLQEKTFEQLPKGIIPDEKTAVAVAEAILIPIYGLETVESERPFKAYLVDDVWHVIGTFNCENCLGGVAYAFIRKQDGKVLGVLHTK